ncbi:MAG: right-handed parallel beta-helix repeat-containing protein [Bacteroidales bacterium]|nr:right-handed parallel beta-helix repeat-containing protein [Bacteroidales bacterium]
MNLNYIFSFLLWFIISILSLSAQPSGGPYGPIKQSYALPDGASNIYYVAPTGNPEASGETLNQPTTIEEAIKRVKTGDAIIMRGGIYRTGNLILNQGITIQPYANEQPVLKGTYEATNWKKQDNGLWTTPWSYLFPAKPANWWRRERNGTTTPLHRFNNDMVFVDGKFLQSAGWEGEVDENSFYIDYENKKVYIGVNPENRLIEITAFDIALNCITSKCHGKSCDHKGPVIKGITFTQYAYRAIEIEGTFPEGLSNEENFGKEIIGTTLEHCIISFCSRVAAYLRGDKLTLRHCKISDTSTEGIYIMSSSDVLLEKNVFTRNNIEKIEGYFPAAVKIFNQCYRVICKDNLIIDLPYSTGVWYDVGNVDGVFVNNWLENVGFIEGGGPTDRLWPSQNAFYFEISKGAICAGNVFVNCDHGISILNSSNVQIYQNTLVNSSLCIGRTPRSAQGDHFGWHPSTGPDVDERYGHIIVNNLLAGDNSYLRPLLFVWQTDTLCERLNEPQLEKLDYNIYIYNISTSSKPFILWSPAPNERCQLQFNSLENFRKKYSEFSSNSQFFDTENISAFKCHELGNFELLESFPKVKAANLPEDIKKAIGIEQDVESYIGAFPIIKE